jgi:oxygen-dependent protoporphyrinogen oxidase
MKRIAIIGGGISGLSAAYALEKERHKGVPVEYVLYEASQRLGGVLRTEHVDGCLLEAGPDSFLTEKSWAADFCREIGLGDQLIRSNDTDRKTYILLNGQLVAIPDGLMFMVPTKILPCLLSPMFSLATKARIFHEWFYPQSGTTHDESVSEFVERHYGREMVERLVEPLLSGIYGGEASQLSVRAVLPRFVEMEAQSGSLGRAMIAARKKATKPGEVSRKPLFTSLNSGMQQIVNGLVSRINESALRVGSTVETIRFADGEWNLFTGGAASHFDGVIVAVPAPLAAKLISGFSSDLAAELGAIRYTSSIVVNLVFDQSVRSSLPPGFGFLVPRSEGKQTLAVTFVHNKFSHRAPNDQALLRCFIGGAKANEAFTLSDEEILRTVREELHEILGIVSTPQLNRVYRWKDAMAQYGVGHLERMERIEGILAGIPCLALAGNAYRGIGIPDCIRSGTDAAAQVLSAVGLGQVNPAVAG